MKDKLTKSEAKILGSFEKGEWQSLGRQTTRRYAKMARRQVKEKRINIRLAASVLDRLRHDAEESGIPYQTLISSVLFRYAAGKLCDQTHILKALEVLRHQR
ncbi:MAG: BrnA antitoxin family protein [Deltaproteobacteria bacterium]|nr:BrnA antitoxin family protein [Deltaproteobacteria bacterium]